MNFNENFFNFPPYLSVSWENVSALRLENSGKLVFHLNTGDNVTLPSLKHEEIEAIFKAHALYLEKKVSFPKNERFFPTPKPHIEGPVRLVFGSIDGVGGQMQHNSALKDTPNLPEEMLSKIVEITRIFAAEESSSLKPEPHCNCPPCQVARALQGNNLPPLIPGLIPGQLPVEEEVQVSDLEFQDWEITQTGDKLYTVTSKIDKLESYSVYLGRPVGCTCGKQNCDHILAVLKS